MHERLSTVAARLGSHDLPDVRLGEDGILHISPVRKAVPDAAGELADRVSLVVTGPVRLSDARGRVWHEYRAEVHPPVAGLGLWPPRRLRRLRR